MAELPEFLTAKEVNKITSTPTVSEDPRSNKELLKQILADNNAIKALLVDIYGKLTDVHNNVLK